MVLIETASIPGPEFQGPRMSQLSCFVIAGICCEGHCQIIVLANQPIPDMGTLKFKGFVEGTLFLTCDSSVWFLGLVEVLG